MISGGLGAARSRSESAGSESLFVSPETNSLDEGTDCEIEEISQELIEPEEEASGIEKLAQPEIIGNVNNLVAMSDYTEGKSLFILPYDAKRRPRSGSASGICLVTGSDGNKNEGSASVPLRQLACSEVLAAAEPGGIRQSRRHNEELIPSLLGFSSFLDLPFTKKDTEHSRHNQGQICRCNVCRSSPENL